MIEKIFIENQLKKCPFFSIKPQLNIKVQGINELTFSQLEQEIFL